MVTRRRNIAFERDVTRLAAKGVANPTELIDHAEARAHRLCGEYVDHPMLVLERGGDVAHIREELVDTRNYLVWWLEENLEDERVPDVQAALRHVILAYDLINDDA